MDYVDIFITNQENIKKKAAGTLKSYRIVSTVLQGYLTDRRKKNLQFEQISLVIPFATKAK